MIVDASVLVAVITPTDAFHALAREWLDRTGDAERVRAPAVAIAEVAGAVARLTGSRSAAVTAITRFTSGNALRLISTNAAFCLRAANIAAEHQIRGCDSMYVALAAQLGETLFTFDREQLERGRAVVRVEQPS